MAKSATGKVTRIYSDPNGCFIRLEYSGDKPKSEYFQLHKSHANYNSLYSLAITAAVNRYDLKIAMKKKIVPTEYGEIVYMVIDW